VALGISPQRLKFYRNAWNFSAAIRISPYRLKFYRAAKPSRFALLNRTAILPCCGYLKFRLFLKFGSIARCRAKFKKRKQIFFRTSACTVKFWQRFKFRDILKFRAARKFIN